MTVRLFSFKICLPKESQDACTELWDSHAHSLDILTRLQVSQHVPDADDSRLRLLGQHILDFARLVDPFVGSRSHWLFAKEGDGGEGFEESEFGVSTGSSLATELWGDAEDC